MPSLSWYLPLVLKFRWTWPIGLSKATEVLPGCSMGTMPGHWVSSAQSCTELFNGLLFVFDVGGFYIWCKPPRAVSNWVPFQFNKLVAYLSTFLHIFISSTITESDHLYINYIFSFLFISQVTYKPTLSFIPPFPFIFFNLVIFQMPWL